MSSVTSGSTERAVMLSAEELLRRIRLGEDSFLELKEVRVSGSRVTPARKDLADEIAAMANSRGGFLILGVNDALREIIGISRKDRTVVENFVAEICNDSVDPPVEVAISFMELADSSGEMRVVIQVEIPESSYVHESPGGYFRRQGSQKRKLSPQALARLFQQRRGAGVIAFDEQTVVGTSAEDLDAALFGPFLRSLGGDVQGDLRKLHLLAEDEGGETRATVAGILMCTPNPECWMPNALIEAVHYRGKQRDSNYQLDAKTITGPLNMQILEALSFAERNMSVEARKVPARIETPQYSPRALFEAIVNAVAHRDYSIRGSKIRMFMFADRFEIYSPGGLPNTLTVESIAALQSTRNEVITSLLTKCPVGNASEDVRRQYFLERRGEGVPIIIEESRALSGREPEYQIIDDEEILLTIWPAQREEDLDP